MSWETHDICKGNSGNMIMDELTMFKDGVQYCMEEKAITAKSFARE